MKIIFHLDLDSYFASASIVNQPELKGKPLAISMGKRRSVIVASSYEAKAMGVAAPMPYWKALEKCPELISLEPNFALYTNLSSKVFELLSENYTTKLEVGSIDECYMDVTDIWEQYGSPIKLAKDMQERILKELKLPASIGISNNKFMAKMSSPVNKPYGITVTKPGSFLEKFGKEDVRKFFGIGAATANTLKENDIYTIGDLKLAKFEILESILGKRATEILKLINEEGTDVIDTSRNDLKGISNSVTFQEQDMSNHKDITAMLRNMTSLVSYRAIKRNQVGFVVRVSIKGKGGKEVRVKSKQVKLARPIQEFDEIWKIVLDIFNQLWKEETIKFVGVSLSTLCNVFESTYQTSLFDDTKEKTKIDQILDDINRKFKKKVVVSGVEQMNNIKRHQNQSRYIESDRIIKHWDLKK